MLNMPYAMQLCCIQLLYATKLHCVWWEVFCCMLHETCCLELDQWSNQATLLHATKLHRVWHALGHTHTIVFRPVVPSHSFTLSSEPQLTTNSPSWVYLTPVTMPLWAVTTGQGTRERLLCLPHICTHEYTPPAYSYQMTTHFGWLHCVGQRWPKDQRLVECPTSECDCLH